jgi:hypothetical protein
MKTWPFRILVERKAEDLTPQKIKILLRNLKKWKPGGLIPRDRSGRIF